MTPTITLVTNSPGEVTTFVRPVLQVLAQRHPDWKRRVAMVPCPYATGAEVEVVRSWGEADEVWGPAQTTWRWLRGGDLEGPGAICFLGGDPWHALLLKRRFRQPAVAYFPEASSWEETNWCGGFDEVALGYRRREPTDSGPQSRPGCFIGDLRVDAVRNRLEALVSSLPSGDRPQTLAIFPGSRWLHLKAILAPFLSVVDRLHEERPDRRFILSVSPFVSRSQLADAAAKPFSLGLTASKAEIRGESLITQRGATVELVWGNPYRVIAECDLALSLPGTNTAELAIAAKPAVIPLSYRVPVGGGGLLGLLDRVLGFGFLKRYLKEHKYQRLKHLALPNQLAGRVVMPEFFVRDDLSDLFDFLSQLLDNAAERQRIGEEARSVMGPAGAAEKFVELVESVVANA